jgi:hypothetical protein
MPDEVLPVVTYAVKRKLAGAHGDYWDAATLLELQVLQRDEEAAQETLSRVFREGQVAWQTQSTARNLRLIRERWEQQSEAATWLRGIECQLGAMPARHPPPLGPQRPATREATRAGRSVRELRDSVSDVPFGASPQEPNRDDPADRGGPAGHRFVQLCRVLDISRSGCSGWQHHQFNRRACADTETARAPRA